MPNDDPCKTYVYLRTAVKAIIETNRREAVREAELRGHAGSNNRGRHPPPALPVGMDDNNNPTKSASDCAVTPSPLTEDVVDKVLDVVEERMKQRGQQGFQKGKK